MNNFEYGIIGNGRSCALVSRQGSIDWCCLADFDSPSVFAALLDDARGGRFAVCPVDAEFSTQQRYLPHTNILVTQFVAASGTCEVMDFMPRYRAARGNYKCPPEVVRVLRPVAGQPRLRIAFDPRLGYAEHATRVGRHAKYLKAETAEGAHESVYLYSNLDLGGIQSGEPFRLDQDAYLLLAYDQKIGEVDMERVELAPQRTKLYWMNWCARTTRTQGYREPVERSALVLKLLSHQPSGAILAATTSLPEQLGAQRNWDYRYWRIRDASMTIRTLVNLGHWRVARRFFEFLLDLVPYENARIQIMYGPRGQTVLTERPWQAPGGLAARKTMCANLEARWQHESASERPRASGQTAGGGRPAPSAPSSVWASASSPASSPRRPTICSPTGKPASQWPAGMTTEGWPVRLNGPL
jgi:GH15 family glucan-1,4-alpha-glucosidase